MALDSIQSVKQNGAKMVNRRKQTIIKRKEIVEEVPIHPFPKERDTQKRIFREDNTGSDKIKISGTSVFRDSSLPTGHSNKRVCLEAVTTSEVPRNSSPPVHNQLKDEISCFKMAKPVLLPLEGIGISKLSQSLQRVSAPWFMKAGDSTQGFDPSLQKYMQNGLAHVEWRGLQTFILTSCDQVTVESSLWFGVFTIFVTDHFREALLSDVITLANSLNNLSTPLAKMIKEICIIFIQRDLSGFLASVSTPSKLTLDLELLARLSFYQTFFNEKDFLTLLDHLSRSYVNYQARAQGKEHKKLLDKVLQRMAHVNHGFHRIVLADKTFQSMVRKTLRTMRHQLSSLCRSTLANSQESPTTDIANYFLKTCPKPATTELNDQTIVPKDERAEFYLTCINQLCDSRYHSVPVFHLLMHNIRYYESALDMSLSLHGSASLKLSTSAWRMRFGSRIPNDVSAKLQSINNGKIPEEILNIFQALVHNECSFIWDGKEEFKDSSEKTDMLIAMSLAFGISDYIDFLAQGRDHSEIIGENWKSIWIHSKDYPIYANVVQYIYRNADKLFDKNEEMFKNLTLDQLRILLDCDDLVLQESYILAAVLKWTRDSATSDFDDMYLWNELKQFIRFIEIDDNLDTLKETGHLSEEEIKVIYEIYQQDKLLYPKGYHLLRNYRPGNKWGKRRESK